MFSSDLVLYDPDIIYNSVSVDVFDSDLVLYDPAIIYNSVPGDVCQQWSSTVWPSLFIIVFL